MNALDTATVLDLERAFVELDLHPEVNVGVVTGAGSRAFSSGADTSEYRDDSSETDDGGATARAAAKQSINAAAESDDREAAFDTEFERWWTQYDSAERRRLTRSQNEES